MKSKRTQKNKNIKILSLIVCCIMVITMFPIQADAADLVADLLDFAAYFFYWRDENGTSVSRVEHTWGEEEEIEKGFQLRQISLNDIQIKIDPTKSDCYQKCKPALMWIHKADGLFDTLKHTDINAWYEKKLEETYLIYAIPDYTQPIDITIQVPIMLATISGLLNGGYYEIEFYDENCVPEQLKYAYEAQTYTLEELEAYINGDMADNMEAYYDADSGFRSDINGFTYQNTDKDINGGRCAGMSSLATAIYNGFALPTSYKVGDAKFNANENYTWYDSIYGPGSIRDLTLEDNTVIEAMSPSYSMLTDDTAAAYPFLCFSETLSENDESFYQLLTWAQVKNNTTAMLRGNIGTHGIALQNLENRWSIIDYIASNLRQGKAITVNLSHPEKGGHAIVGYKMEKIGDDIYRLHCYDNNFPDDMSRYWNKDAEHTKEVNEDGSYKNIQWHSREVYIDFTKKTIIGHKNEFQQCEYEVFEFDASHTSFAVTSADRGVVCFTLFKGNSVGVFNYGNKANEVVAYKAFPVINDDGTVFIRTFAFYKSGEVIEITKSLNTNVKMDYNYLGWYKFKDGKLTLTKKGYQFSDDGMQYIECYVSYNNSKNENGQIKVRIPVEKIG